LTNCHFILKISNFFFFKKKIRKKKKLLKIVPSLFDTILSSKKGFSKKIPFILQSDTDCGIHLSTFLITVKIFQKNFIIRFCFHQPIGFIQSVSLLIRF
jgi:hypothetical protein